jgi:hypothetical protein
MTGTYFAVTRDGTLRQRFKDLGGALRWFDSLPTASHLIGPSGLTVADRREDRLPA